jgi:hypothetical protein
MDSLSSTDLTKLTLDEAFNYLCRHFDSYTRLPALLELVDRMEDSDWVMLLGRLWSEFDNIGIHSDEILVEMDCQGWDMESLIDELMSPEERVAFDALPEQITIYRGYGPLNIHGISWSLDRRTAEQFSFMARYRTPEPILVTATINKSSVAALKLDRGEQESSFFFSPEEHSTYWREEQLSGPPLGPKVQQRNHLEVDILEGGNSLENLGDI